MSEYWVSKKRYYCKYCEIYIADDAPSRQHHESGMRHKGNKERFVRGLYKAGEKQKKDAEEEKREMVRIEQAAQAAFSQDIGAGHAKASTSALPARASLAAPPPKPARPTSAFANYSTAESLGYTDPDLERAQAEAERRRTQGLAGEWQYVQSSPTPHGEASPAPGEEHASCAHPGKRALDDADELGRGWKLRKKAVSTGLGEIYDPGFIPIKLKPKKEEVKEESVPAAAVSLLGGDVRDVGTAKVNATTGPQASSIPKWTATRWKKAGESANGEQAGISSATPESSVPPDDAARQAAPVTGEQVRSEDTNGAKETAEEKPALPVGGIKKEDIPVKIEEAAMAPEAPSGGLFKKRRVPASGGASRGRRS
ncbi:hypothetical protein EWM64_g7669 [Hericium alpestre]|uniref:Matrin-type domain-containing protein n=1 Tax=Hericium alpestre TaxID=135208 RepID=A0A4Y9ZN98_9AGAM|nr:hypothetical protein EWM64_g7669 [Hericium alpestre]